EVVRSHGFPGEMPGVELAYRQGDVLMGDDLAEHAPEPADPIDIHADWQPDAEWKLAHQGHGPGRVERVVAVVEQPSTWRAIHRVVELDRTLLVLEGDLRSPMDLILRGIFDVPHGPEGARVQVAGASAVHAPHL